MRFLETLSRKFTDHLHFRACIACSNPSEKVSHVVGSENALFRTLFAKVHKMFTRKCVVGGFEKSPYLIRQKIAF